MNKKVITCVLFILCGCTNTTDPQVVYMLSSRIEKLEKFTQEPNTIKQNTTNEVITYKLLFQMLETSVNKKDLSDREFRVYVKNTLLPLCDHKVKK